MVTVTAMPVDPDAALIALTLQAEATTDRALSEARQNISNPWPYLEIKTVLHVSTTDESRNMQMVNHETAKQKPPPPTVNELFRYATEQAFRLEPVLLPDR